MGRQREELTERQSFRDIVRERREDGKMGRQRVVQTGCQTKRETRQTNLCADRQRYRQT